MEKHAKGNKEEDGEISEYAEKNVDSRTEKSGIKGKPVSCHEDKIEIPRSEFEELKKKAGLCNEYQDKLMRLGAEFDNTRKRMNKEKEELVRFAARELIIEILPVVDDFDRLIEGMKNKQIDSALFEETVLFEGIKMIQKRMHELLSKNGLIKMEVAGQKFDPTKHEALFTTETDEHPENTILEEIRAGYLLHGRLVRPAVVRVSKLKGPETRGQNTRAPEHQDTSAPGHQDTSAPGQ